jgi:DtxR family Mn-dependent transcriptional regulator
MTDPLITLLLGVLVVAVLLVLLFPGRSLLARLARGKQDAARVMMEDALKHAYDCEYKGVTATISSIAGALAIPVDEASRLAARLESHRLVSQNPDSLVLTPEGRSYALRVLRIHRLWERYLADETSVRESDWHQEAELQEHRLTTAQADALAAQMGNPQLDPHGDPIPSSNGELPSREGQSLTELSNGAVAQIVHIEDEPPTIYAQLVAEGLYPGMQVVMLEQTRGRVRFEANGDEVVLAPLLARNITVLPLPEGRKLKGPFRTLAAAGPGEKVTVLAISRACRGAQRRRLMDLGIVPGTVIEPELSSLGGDPVAYIVRGTLVALRRQQAEQIFVKPPEPSA